MISTPKVENYLVIPHCRALAYKVSISNTYAVLDFHEVMPFIQPNELLRVLSVYYPSVKMGGLVANVLAQTLLKTLNTKYKKKYMQCAADMIDIQDFRHIMFNFADSELVEFLHALQNNKSHAFYSYKALDIYFLAYPNCGVSKEDFEKAFFDNFMFIMNDADADLDEYQAFVTDTSKLYTV
jgi:hypothetical protein